MATASGRALSFRWRWLLPVALAVGLFHVVPIRATLDRAFFDAGSRRPLTSTPPPDGSAIVLMDNATLDALSKEGFGGTWPPPRGVFAALIAGLQRAGAATIVVDFVFLDHSAAVEQDQLLGALTAGLPHVVLARTRTQQPAFWSERFRGDHAALFSRPRMGLADANTDGDGVIRHYLAPESLAAAALANPTSATGGLLRWHGGLADLNVPSSRVPVLSAASFVLAGLPTLGRLMEATPDGNFDPLKLAARLAAEPPLRGEAFDSVRGRIVFVGASATGSFDQKPFAIGGLEPGVLVHWTAWANLVQDAFIRPLHPVVAPLLAAGFLAGLALLTVRKSGLLLPVVAALALAAGTLFAAYAGLSHGWFLAPATPVLATGLGLIGVVAEKFWTERRRRHEVQAMFGSYVAPEVVELLVRDPNAIKLGGERREATVFFCDLAGFTDLSEIVTPDELLELINGYLQETSDCLMEYGAYIDKYIGDAVMAVFGAPLDQPGHALAACRGALAAQRVLAARNTRLQHSHGRTLHMRIGINTGSMLVGNLGSERKKNYTVLGDAVNLASRLEGANKEFGTSILLGETTAALVRDTLVVRPLTALRVKGKQTAVEVFELVGEPGDLTPEKKTFLAAYGEGHALYTARRFAEAAAALERAAALAPDDDMTRNLLTEARDFATTPPPADWQPILSLKSK
ncbi:CHASE2 domain-containing protein [Horticoccus sp. 23ND18S-11]|uniref:CHASE2 domain-containing protein n=1 Tax=Horticoccus sp. 23ND18S-11 TaxID=3391832 RepID=UPI0039C99BAA